MPAALLVPAIIGAAGAGASLVGAKMGSNASRDAAKLQVASADRAQQFNDRAYADQKAAMNPYMQLGTDAMARYQQKYGGQKPAPGGGQPSLGPWTMPDGTQYANGVPGVQRGQYVPPQGGPQGGGQPQSMSPFSGMFGAAAAMAPGGLARPQGGPQGPSMQAGAPPQAGPMVKLQAPTGEVQDVPQQVADQLIARGAVRIG